MKQNKINTKDMEKYLQDTIETKMHILVRARKAEFWIKDNLEEYYNVVKNYKRTCRRIKAYYSVKKYPIWIHFMVHIRLFFKNPYKYVNEFFEWKKVLAEGYWTFKSLKKEWEEDFDQTEKNIQEDYRIVKILEEKIKNIREFLTKTKVVNDKVE